MVVMKALHSFVLSYSAPNRKSILKKTDFQGQNIFSLNVTEDIASVLVTAHALHMALAFSHYIWHSDRVTTSHKVEDMQGYNAVNPRLWISIKLRKPRNPEVLLMKTMTKKQWQWDSNEIQMWIGTFHKQCTELSQWSHLDKRLMKGCV